MTTSRSAFRRALFVLLLVASAWLPFAAVAQEGWKDADGRPAPPSEATGAAEGFSATLIVTPDQDWREKWETPEHVAPSFTTTDRVERDGHIFVLAFFSNPGLDGDRMADVTCDVRVVRPDGSLSLDESGLDCFRMRVESDPKNVYLAEPAIGFIAEEADPRGLWHVEVTLHDRQRGVSVPLRTSFTYE